MSWEPYGEASYAAHQRTLGQDTLYPWDQLSPREKAAWIDGARSAISRFCGVAMAQYAGSMQDLTPVYFPRAGDLEGPATPRRK